jgi:cellulose 1,4-beta-cellobiosidase
MMQSGIFLILRGLSLIALASAQGPGDKFQEGGPKINLYECDSPGSCNKKSLVFTMDANWRYTHLKGEWDNCYKKNLWVSDPCKGDDGAGCAKQCVVEGIPLGDYEKKYGISPTRNGDGVSMRFQSTFTAGEETYTSVGARLYMVDGENYYMFRLLNKEFAFDADMSQLECGMNGAVYYIEMEENGGKGKGANTAGAKYGTGYCDAQCPHDIKYIDGEANIKGWKPNPKDKSENMGVGYYGACCNEMDIWEANSMSAAYTPHPCSKPGMYRCEGTECGDNDKGERYKGVCDKDGCDFASWRMGARNFYGRGSQFEVDTSKELTQVTQFLTDDESDSGTLVEIRRVWKQGGKVIANTDAPHMKGCLGEGNSLTDDICKSQNEKFGDYNHFQELGGNGEMGRSLDRGHVLSVSLWDDVDVSMMWLDSWYPRDKDKEAPGVSRGPCVGGEKSTPIYVRKNFAENVVEYWNFKWGCIGCTTDGIEKGPKTYKPADCRRRKKPCKECTYGGGRRRKNDGGDDDKDDGGDDDKDEGDSRRRRRSKDKDDSDSRRRRRSKDKEEEEKGRRRRRSKKESERRRRRSKDNKESERRRRRSKKESERRRRRRSKKESEHRRRRRRRSRRRKSSSSSVAEAAGADAAEVDAAEVA